MFDKRINIFTGHFGSGKTEIALNCAVKLAEKNRTSIVDLDIVNPFFRTADAKEDMEKRGINVLVPVYANSNVDVPAIPPQIYSLFEDKDTKVVLDIGGDDLGAKAVARFGKEIRENDYDIFIVINTKRPMTDSLEKILAMIDEISLSSGFRPSWIVNNTNILEYTTADDIVEGHELIKKASEISGIPIGFIAGMGESIVKASKKLDIPYLEMGKYIKLPW